MPIIKIQNLKKSYGQKLILKGINLEIEPGQVIGYIGPNGAGKSTTVRVLAGLDAAFSGQVNVAGFDVNENPTAVKKLIGYVPEQTELYDVLTPMEFLGLLGKLHDLEEEVIQNRAMQMLEYFGLKEHRNQRLDTFSKGMRQKVLLISGLLHNPQILFLDEPLAGLDANAVIMVKEIIEQLAAEGKTIFYCSHIMDTVEKVSDRIILIDNGQIIADGTFKELQQNEGKTLERIFSDLTQKGGSNLDAASFLNTLK